ncbi:DUF3261 domain-containing protein [Chitinimonas viridis]|uniref:DUF3261 domain-containing protein n=1 Tax=Chitinimonas viridis TaxID=664880 RepID=A0ABT8B2T7_9NEIS|nr:DUF3261 domain-containing protein [Chitinimonas viridis]MDN3576319.1 DUF3261 domain-containing protein [Chitinimonas viridis]
MRRLIATAALLLAACASTPEPRSAMPALRLAPAAFGSSVSLAQRLTLERVENRLPGKREETPRVLEALLEIDPSTVQLAGIALGQRVLTLSWDGQDLQQNRHPKLPAEVDGGRVLRDVQLAYWPAESIRQALPAGWVLLDDQGLRQLQQDGVTALSVRYSANPRWAGDAVLENQREGYRLQIESRLQSTEPAP